MILFVGDPKRTEKRFWLATEVINYLKTQADVDLVIANGVSHEQMPLFMNACDVLLITSSSEGSPTIVKEALACSLPIVSVDVGDVCASIGNIPGCVVAQDELVATLSLELMRIIEKPYRLNYAIDLSKIDEANLVQKVISVYEQAIKKKR